MRQFAALTGQPAPTAAAALPPPFPEGSAAQILPEPNEQAKSAGAPSIHLAGKDWPIPLLAPRQNRIVVPAVAKITQRMKTLAGEKLASLKDDERRALIEAIGSETELRSRIWKTTDFAVEIIQQLEPAFFDTIADALYWALTRAHPQLTRQIFDDMPIGTIEMIDAVGIVAQQTGMMRQSADPLVTAGGQQQSPSSQTGTPSSPMSATD